MIVYHVCSYKKLQKYMENKSIKPPVRAWINIEEAERFSKQTARRIILRLKFKEGEYEKYEGHKGMAVVMRDKSYILNDF